MRSPNFLRLVVAGATILAAHACGGEDGQTAGNGGFGAAKSDASAGTGGGAADGGIILPDGGGEVESLSVEPANATIAVQNGTSSPAQFVAKAKLKGGGEVPVTVTWSFDRVDLGVVNPAGTLTAHGTKGGVGTVQAQLQGLTATAQATVQLSLSANPAGLSQAEQDAFNTPTGGPSGTLLYPYDNTVFGRGILPPELMWSGGGAGDTYKIRIADAFVELVSFVSADPPSRFLLDKAWWTQLTESSDGAPVSVSVQRTSGGTVHQPTTQSWKIAPGSLRGTIYYWAVNTGQIMKINPGAEAPVPAFDPGPANQLGTPAPVSGYAGQNPPWDSTGSGKRCVACHTVSKDGTTLAALFSACETPGGCGRPWGIVDTATEQIQLVSNYKPATAIFSALTPNGSHLVYDRTDFTMRMADPKTGADIPSALDSLTQVAHPQFSPEGKLLAYLTSVTGAYPVEFSNSNLSVMDVDLTTAPHFTNPRLLAQAANANEEIAFPSFTPDAAWVVYQRGNYSRAKFGAAAPFQTGFNELFMSDVAGQGTHIKLDLANGAGVLTAKDHRRNYQPRVNPVAVGGYFWVVFVSPRDYGNRMQSASDSTNENRNQLWVAAIDANPTAGSDPSHPAFLLPGQDLSTINMDAYWALEPCKQNGIECNEGYECCTGFCRDQGNGTFQCVPPPVNECSLVGEKCTTTADCCQPPGSAIQCIGGVCGLQGPR